MRLGLYDHFGWAIAVVVDDDHAVVDRRRIELVEDGLTPAPVHYDAAGLDDAALAALIARVRGSIATVGGRALDALPGPITSMSLRTWPADFPTDLATIRRSPWEARADAVMHRQVLAELAGARGWAVHTYDAKSVEAQATALVGPLPKLPSPWTKDHRIATAATVLAAR